MKTLIELYDERPMENILSSEVFLPERCIFLLSENEDPESAKQRINAYFRYRGLPIQTRFYSLDMYNSQEILNWLKTIVNKYEDCVLDISGGTDAALFAAGLLCRDHDVPVFTYSRSSNCFYNIQNALFADNYKNPVQYRIEDFLKMAGGSMSQGRVDNRILYRYMDLIDKFFDIYMTYRKKWVNIITWIQCASRASQAEDIPLEVSAERILKTRSGVRTTVSIEALQAFESIGMIGGLSWTDETVSFVFGDHQIRTWLRDIGSVLELYTYKCCLDAGVFSDVSVSVVVDWKEKSDVSNEIDVMAAKGVTPFFISCKTSDVRTEALNELAILRSRFGGEMARAAIVTTQYANAAIRHRALELKIDVIDLTLLEENRLRDSLISLSR